MCQQVDAFADYFARGAGDWPDDDADDFEEIVSCHHDDPEKALAYVVIAASRSSDAAFLGYVGCGPLEDILRDPSAELLERVVAEARKSALFRWLLSHPFKAAIAEPAWEAIKGLRTTGPSEEPAPDTLPPRRVS
jgi:hypothetical protein